MALPIPNATHDTYRNDGGRSRIRLAAGWSAACGGNGYTDVTTTIVGMLSTFTPTHPLFANEQHINVLQCGAIQRVVLLAQTSRYSGECGSVGLSHKHVVRLREWSSLGTWYNGKISVSAVKLMRSHSHVVNLINPMLCIFDRFILWIDSKCTEFAKYSGICSVRISVL